MTTVASQITSLAIVYSIVYSGADERKHQSSASLAFVRGIHRDRWIPSTKGQLRGKCFHLMTSSWVTRLPTSFEYSLTATGYVNRLVQERRNSSALAMELRLSCTNSSMCVAQSYSSDADGDCCGRGGDWCPGVCGARQSATMMMVLVVHVEMLGLHRTPGGFGTDVR